MVRERRLGKQQIIDILCRSNDPVAIYTGEEILIELANPAMQAAWGRGPEVMGKKLSDALPEIADQPFIDMLQEVWRSGKDNTGEAISAELFVDGKLQQYYFDYAYLPIKDEHGEVYAIMHTAMDVTQKVINDQELNVNRQKAMRLEREQALNEELATSNEELLATNEELHTAQENLYLLNQKLEDLVDERTGELTAINGKLHKSQELLIISNLDLKTSEARLEKILSELPVPVVVLMGPNQIIHTTNQSILRFWGRTKDEVMGKTMLEVFPELNNQSFPQHWKQVFETGLSYTSSESKVTYKNSLDGSDRTFYIDYYCQVLKDLAGNNVGIISTVVDITEKVKARKQIEKAEAQLRLAIDSLELGTWHLDVVTHKFQASARLKQIFGFHEENEMTYSAAVAVIQEEYQPLVIKAVDQAILEGASYNVEYPLKGLRDGELRWVRATGKRYEEDDGTARFSGTVQDITQRKLEEQRKDDFISIASHELKTPITTLKGALQLLDRYKSNLNMGIVPRLIDQANISIGKIAKLIDDLLHTSRTTEGQLHLNMQRFAISRMLDQCCNHIHMNSKHELIVRGDVDLEVEADEARIDQVVVNFINNAVKYAPESKEIFLLVEDMGESVKISVKDLGSGIPSEKIPHLFDRYYRADYNGLQYSGLGLGLYISAEIVKRHRGEIGVESKVGEGSTFWFTLPKRRLDGFY